jgi:hypothetical protein
MLPPPPEVIQKTLADRRLAKKFLFWAFVVSILYIHFTYTFILYKHHKVFVRAVNTQHTCGTPNALERETARFILRQHYLAMDDETNDAELYRYNWWRVWVLSMPVMIAVAIFMVIKYGVDVISPWFYVILTIVILYLGVHQLVTLPRYFGYPSYWDIFSTKLGTGKIQRILQFHTQAYDQLYMLFDSLLAPCLDENAEFACMEVLPSKFKQELIRRYVSANPTSNEYQAADYFETALKKREYDTVIAYMRLGNTSDDLEQLSGAATSGGVDMLLDDSQIANFRDNLSKEMLYEIQQLFAKSFYQNLLLGWIFFVYFIWFHRRVVPLDEDIDPTLRYFWPLIAVSWVVYLFMY